MVSVGYLALTGQVQAKRRKPQWRGWYHYFPWEDWRDSKPAMIESAILPALKKFVKDAPNAETAELRRERVNVCFGEGAGTKNGCWSAMSCCMKRGWWRNSGATAAKPDKGAGLGTPMLFDHRRILATAIARLRGKLKYRPVVFELMAPTFTLLELQRAVEALAGLRLHKQNFRRLVAEQGWWKAPASSPPLPAAGPPNCSASAARCCASAPRPACGWVCGAANRHRAFAEQSAS